MARRRTIMIGSGCALAVASTALYIVVVGEPKFHAEREQSGATPPVESDSGELLGLRTEFSSLPIATSENEDDRQAGERRAGEKEEPEQFTSFVWREPSLTSVPNRKQASFIVEKWRAELLAPFLTETWRRLLDKELEGIDEIIRSTAAVYDASVADAKASMLANRPERVIRVAAGVPKTAPERGLLLETMAKVEGHSGAVWADIDGTNGDEVHYVFLWEEWPIIRDLLGDLSEMTSERRLMIREWISDQWKIDGYELLKPK